MIAALCAYYWFYELSYDSSRNSYNASATSHKGCFLVLLLVSFVYILSIVLS